MDETMMRTYRAQQLYKKYERIYKEELLRLSFRISGSEAQAEKAVADTGKTLITKLLYSTDELSSGKVYALCRRTALENRYCSWEQEYYSQYDRAMDELLENITEAPSEEYLRINLWEFLIKLSPEHRGLFLKRYWLCEALPDIARQEKLSEENVAGELGDLRSQLQDYPFRAPLTRDNLQKALAQIGTDMITEIVGARASIDGCVPLEMPVARLQPRNILGKVAKGIIALVIILAMLIPGPSSGGQRPYTQPSYGLPDYMLRTELKTVPMTTFPFVLPDYSDPMAFQKILNPVPAGYADSLNGFWQDSIPLCLSDSENAVCSPVSLYLALAMLAQTTGGESQQELLRLLNAGDMDTLARQARYVILSHYEKGESMKSNLSCSLWLNKGLTVNPEIENDLYTCFYADLKFGDLASPTMNDALKKWINEKTGNLLQDSVADLENMDAQTLLSIATAVEYRCSWQNGFLPEAGTQDVFYSSAGEKTVSYMNRSGVGSYYRGQGYTATYLPLGDGSRMWLILPDSESSVEQLLREGNALNMIFGVEPQEEVLMINLSVPKFDISENSDLTGTVEALGVCQALDPAAADFSPFCSTQGIYIRKILQGTRVFIDEEGLAAAAYTVMTAPGAAMPPEEEVDFVLNRPFLFVVESKDGLPLFAGTVNQP